MEDRLQRVNEGMKNDKEARDEGKRKKKKSRCQKQVWNGVWERVSNSRENK